MQYAAMASSIVNEPIKNEDERGKLLYELKVIQIPYFNNYQKKNRALETELVRANEHIAFLSGLTGEKNQSPKKTGKDTFLSSLQPNDQKKPGNNLPLSELKSDDEPQRPFHQEEETKNREEEALTQKPESDKESNMGFLKFSMPDIEFKTKVKIIVIIKNSHLEDN